MKVRLYLAAEAELAEVADWYGQKSEELRTQFLADFRQATRLIAKVPQAAPPLTADIRRYLMSRFPYGIVYEIVGKEIRIIAVAHLKRRKYYWRRKGP